MNDANPISIMAHAYIDSRRDPRSRGIDPEATFAALSDVDQVRERLIAADVLKALRRAGYVVAKSPSRGDDCPACGRSA